jgi:hypothetical protein
MSDEARRTMELAKSDPEVLEVMARSYYASQLPFAESWDDLEEYVREDWRQKAIEVMEDFASKPLAVQTAINRMALEYRTRNYDQRKGEDPFGGSPDSNKSGR